MNKNTLKSSYGYSQWYLSKTPKPDDKFIKWINLVEQMVIEFFSIELLDLPDEDYMENYENKITPIEMFNIIYEHNLIK